MVLIGLLQPKLWSSDCQVFKTTLQLSLFRQATTNGAMLSFVPGIIILEGK